MLSLPKWLVGQVWFLRSAAKMLLRFLFLLFFFGLIWILVSFERVFILNENFEIPQFIPNTVFPSNL